MKKRGAAAASGGGASAAADAKAKETRLGDQEQTLRDKYRLLRATQTPVRVPPRCHALSYVMCLTATTEGARAEADAQRLDQPRRGATHPRCKGACKVRCSRRRSSGSQRVSVVQKATESLPATPEKSSGFKRPATLERRLEQDPATFVAYSPDGASKRVKRVGEYESVGVESETEAAMLATPSSAAAAAGMSPMTTSSSVGAGLRGPPMAAHAGLSSSGGAGAGAGSLRTSGDGDFTYQQQQQRHFQQQQQQQQQQQVRADAIPSQHMAHLAHDA